ncbi:DUF2231 domain-containing protein [Kaistella polysaccharea]|uniref:DUF2231 domain-containing protein n=1 Tax=Kaistella polysaccharea TaxID=2878534 RepID=UPI001CF57CC2|nr:DUF2231 domain-containing protein [Kaistella polysaccharea]
MMIQKNAIRLIEEQEWLETAGDALQPAIINTFEAGGDAGQKIKNFLHGTWLGHPLHPVIKDVPIGAWTMTAILDVAELTGSRKYKNGADAAVAIGIVGALGAAVTGLTDWTGTTTKKRKIGLMHGMLNIGATALYATSYVLRKNKKTRGTAIALSMAGYGVVSLAAYLGGHLVFGEQVGVDHTATSEEYPTDFVAVLAENELQNNSMKSVKAGEISVLLAKQNNKIYAIANTCSHLGGPLNEGELLEGGKVKCPWHDSVFSLEDGCVINGPASEKQPQFEIRLRNGQIEVKKSN